MIIPEAEDCYSFVMLALLVLILLFLLIWRINSRKYSRGRNLLIDVGIPLITLSTATEASPILNCQTLVGTLQILYFMVLSLLAFVIYLRCKSKRIVITLIASNLPLIEAKRPDSYSATNDTVLAYLGSLGILVMFWLSQHELVPLSKRSAIIIGRASDSLKDRYRRLIKAFDSGRFDAESGDVYDQALSLWRYHHMYNRYKNFGAYKNILNLGISALDHFPHNLETHIPGLHSDVDAPETNHREPTGLLINSFTKRDLEVETSVENEAIRSVPAGNVENGGASDHKPFVINSPISSIASTADFPAKFFKTAAFRDVFVPVPPGLDNRNPFIRIKNVISCLRSIPDTDRKDFANFAQALTEAMMAIGDLSQEDCRTLVEFWKSTAIVCEQLKAPYEVLQGVHLPIPSLSNHGRDKVGLVPHVVSPSADSSKSPRNRSHTKRKNNTVVSVVNCKKKPSN